MLCDREDAMTDDELDFWVDVRRAHMSEAAREVLADVRAANDQMRQERDSARAEVEKLRAAIEEAVLYIDDCLSQEAAIAFKARHGIGV